MYEFRLYVIADTPSSKTAIISLESLLEDELKGLYSLQVVDVLGNPQLADKEGIFATPTLVRSVPPPRARIIGDMSKREKVLPGLALSNEGRSDNADE
jgi:circadian clock protein KaiB